MGQSTSHTGKAPQIDLAERKLHYVGSIFCGGDHCDLTRLRLPDTINDMQSMSIRPKRRSAGGGLYPSGAVIQLAVLVFLSSAMASLVTAQTTARRTVWDGVYTEAQATRGVAAFGQSCAGCHALAAEGRAPLAGDAFWKSFAQKTVGELLAFISDYMPNGTPGSLSPATYSDIVALILKTNGFPAGNTELARDTATGVQIVQRDGRSELPANALVRVVGCLAKSGADWVITSATAPERAERTGGEDATRPLGSRTMQLKFVISRLDSLVGSRIAVNGLLMGTDGVDGINVTGVSRVAQKCP
jgi:S-disulfanyl-L-cysteine oxidoreductase SoxD